MRLKFTSITLGFSLVVVGCFFLGCGQKNRSTPIPKPLLKPTPKPLNIKIDWVEGVAFLGNNRLVTGCSDSTFQVWDLETRTILHKLKASSAAMIAMSSDGKKLLATTSEDKKLKIWDTDKGTLVKKFAFDSIASAVVFSPDGQWLAVASGYSPSDAPRQAKQATVHVYRCSDWQLLQTLKTTPRPIRSIDFSPLKSDLLVTSRQEISIWDWKQGQKRKTQFVGDDVSGTENTGAFYSHTGSIIAAGYGGEVFLFDADLKQKKAKIDMTPNPKDYDYQEIKAISFSPDDRYLATGNMVLTTTGTLYPTKVDIWRTRTGKLVRSVDGITGPNVTVAYSPDGQHIAAGGGVEGDERGQVCLVNAITGEREWCNIDYKFKKRPVT